MRVSAHARTFSPLLQGTYGPFTPNMPVSVPLWLALALQRRKKCRILPPDWMNPDTLQGRTRADSLLAVPIQPIRQPTDTRSPLHMANLTWA